MEKKASGFPWDTLFYMGPLAHSVSHVKLDLFELWDTLPYGVILRDSSPPLLVCVPTVLPSLAAAAVTLTVLLSCRYLALLICSAHGSPRCTRKLRTRREYKFVHLAQRSLLTPYTVAKPALAGVRGSRQNELRLASYEVKSHNAHRDDAALPSPGAL
ncbi:hypothetical protein DFH06DRAFT_1337207 [Mycena polygramma]|nr:hypothetical protein DFH06DRAFT_1337207 [Mycena polygramma]